MGKDLCDLLVALYLLFSSVFTVAMAIDMQGPGPTLVGGKIEQTPKSKP
jgi:hypothetical protein